MEIIISGRVQGVGFRPFIYRAANNLGLRGFVKNTTGGVVVEAQGKKQSIENLLTELKQNKPQGSIISKIDKSILTPTGYHKFEIKPSATIPKKSAPIQADIATCQTCIEEIFDPKDRRYLYPFTSCTACGPRYSIIESVPYDRANTTMKGFSMCSECKSEYEDPLDRRFHSQTNCCAKCGPNVELWDSGGNSLATKDEAIAKAIKAIKNGEDSCAKRPGGISSYYRRSQ